MNGVWKLLPVLLAGWVLTGCDSSSDSNNESNTTNVYDASSYETSALTEDMKYSLAYMWHEEKMAYDLYLTLGGQHSLDKMKKIANNGEATHIAMVQGVVEKYDLNVTNLDDYEATYSETELEELNRGEFALPEIQALYDGLLSEGTPDSEAAFKVGCKVEVRDINDLTLYISQAGEAVDLVDTFTYLREGSYKHYWAFDAELKAIGVSDGCCSVGVVGGVDYCHTEYPKN